MAISRIMAAACSLWIIAVGVADARAGGKPKPPPSPPPTYPAARVWHNITTNGGMTAATSRVYMHGGDNSPSLPYLNDLWYFSAASGQWTFLAPSGRSWPELGRGNGTLSCGDGKCVLFGGVTGTKALNETWYFAEPSDSATTVSWTQVSCKTPGSCPSARYLQQMAFDPTRGYHVMFGGYRDAFTFGDTWTFSGTSWSKHSPVTSPPIRSFGSATFVPSHVSGGTTVTVDKVVVFGGDPYPNAPYPAALCDLWAWNGSTWEAISAPDPKPCLVGATMGWDTTVADHPRLVVAGGFYAANGPSNTTDTWYFTFTGDNNGTWSKASTVVCAPLPYARGAYDAPSKKLVFFGGSDGRGNEYDDTLVCP